MPLLPLDIWRQEIGLNPWLFWGLADNSVIKDNSSCSGLLREYSWQGSDTAGRDDLRRATLRAEEKLFSYLGYRNAPRAGRRVRDMNLLPLYTWLGILDFVLNGR